MEKYPFVVGASVRAELGDAALREIARNLRPTYPAGRVRRTNSFQPPLE
ncbi:hypothetical protein ACWDSJ_35780 [Nocardia sp. NPDC003482]